MDNQSAELASFAGTLMLSFCVFLVLTIAVLDVLTRHAGLIDVSFSSITMAVAIIARPG